LSGDDGMEPLRHAPGPHPDWNESYYFVFSDTRSGLNGMTRLGFKPNKNEAMTFLLLFLPDGRVAGFQAVEEMGLAWPRGQLRVAGMSHERWADGSWVYSFRGRMVVVGEPEEFPKIGGHPELIRETLPASMDISFAPINETYEYARHMIQESLRFGRRSGDEHWEQIALSRGRITLGGETYELRDVMSQRDHTHGVRDWTGVGDWLYYVVWFNPGLAINPAAIVLEDGGVSTGGFLFRGGRNVPLRTIRVIDQRFRDRIIPVSSTLEIEDAEGVRHILRARAGPAVPLPFRDGSGKVSVLAQCFGSFELDGLGGGYGSYETLRVKRG
jgi:hypothetical protein